MTKLPLLCYFATLSPKRHITIIIIIIVLVLVLVFGGGGGVDVTCDSYLRLKLLVSGEGCSSFLLHREAHRRAQQVALPRASNSPTAKAGSGSQALLYLVRRGDKAGAKVPSSSRKRSITSPLCCPLQGQPFVSPFNTFLAIDVPIHSVAGNKQSIPPAALYAAYLQPDTTHKSFSVCKLNG